MDALQLLSTREAAEALGISRAHLCRLVKHGTGEGKPVAVPFEGWGLLFHPNEVKRVKRYREQHPSPHDPRRIGRTRRKQAAEPNP